MNQLSKTYLEDVKEKLSSMRESTLDLAESLYNLRESKEWEVSGMPWSEFVEAELGVSAGFVSKLVSNHYHYRVLNDVPRIHLEDVDGEKLYLASKTEGDVDLQVSRAKTWARDDFKAQKKDECNNHEYESFCKHCWKKQAND